MDDEWLFAVLTTMTNTEHSSQHSWQSFWNESVQQVTGGIMIIINNSALFMFMEIR